MSEQELKPCPFCGDAPELPSGDGTQYEIECGGCGQAKASVQICDLMTLDERAADTFTDYRYGEEFVERAKVEAIERWNTRATSPAGVDGLEVVAVARNIRNDDPYGLFREIPVFDTKIRFADGTKLVTLDGAQAIIDGLRGELRSLEEYAAGRMNKNHDLCQQLNKLAMRVAELEAYMRCIQRMPVDDEFAERIIELIDSALSAPATVCAAAPNIAPTSEHSGS